MRLAVLLLWLLVALAPAVAADDPQAMYDAASRLEDAGDAAGAAEAYYALLEALRAAGRGDTPDAGLAAAGVARALEALDHDRTDDAWRLAVALLARADDPRPLVAATVRFAERMLRAGTAAEAVPAVEAMLARAGEPDTPADLRVAAIEAAVAVFGHLDRRADADRAIALADGLGAAGPAAAQLSGIARLDKARRAEAEGRRADAVAALDGAVEDLRRAGDDGADLFGTVLLLRGRLAFADGDYRLALDRLDEAVVVLARAGADPAERHEATALRIRMLLRFERLDEALAAADAAIADAVREGGDGSIPAVGLRLDRVEILLAAGRRSEAEAALDAEARRLDGTADPVLAAFYFERLAGAHRAAERFREAMSAADEAIRIRRDSGQPEATLLEPMRIRADASIADPDVAMSERAHRDLVDLSRRIFPATHPELARDLNALATFLSSQRAFGEAAAILRGVVEILSAAYGDDAPKVAYALGNLAIARMFDGGAEEAAGLLERSIAITDRLPETGDYPLIARINLASAFDLLGRFEEMLALVREVEARQGALPRRYHAGLAGLEMRALAGLRRWDEAMAAGRRMLAADAPVTYEDAQNLLIGIGRFAAVALAAGHPAEGLDLARDAVRRTGLMGIGGGAAWREAATALVGSAWAVAASR